MKFKKFQHTILMKFGRPLASIFHYTIIFNWEGCKSFVPDMDPNTILKIKNIIKRRLESEILKIPTYHPDEIW